MLHHNNIAQQQRCFRLKHELKTVDIEKKIKIKLSQKLENNAYEAKQYSLQKARVNK